MISCYITLCYIVLYSCVSCACTDVMEPFCVVVIRSCKAALSAATAVWLSQPGCFSKSGVHFLGVLTVEP